MDRGVEPSKGKGERVWILDPIDGTKGLITGQQVCSKFIIIMTSLFSLLSKLHPKKLCGVVDEVSTNGVGAAKSAHAGPLPNRPSIPPDPNRPNHQPQYIVGLAMCVDGEAVVASMGNPGVDPAVMLAVRGHGLRYCSSTDPTTLIDQVQVPW